MERQRLNEYAGIGSQLQQAAGSAAPISPFDRLAGAVDRLLSVQKQTAMIADRLTGVASEVPGKSHGEVCGGGLLDSLDRQAVYIEQITTDIADNLRRIENRL